MSTPNATDPNIIKIHNARLSYPNVFTAKAVEGSDKLKFSANLILNKKEHAALIKQIETSIARVALDKFKKKVTLKHPCLRDGADVADKDGYGDEVMFLVAKSSVRPPVVNRDKSPITEGDGIIYGGCYVNASVRLFAWEHPTGGKGVSADLRAIQFLKDGPSFGAGKVDAEQEFDEVTEDDVSDKL